MFFVKQILAFIRPFAISTSHCQNLKGLKLITGLRSGFSHFQFKKFKHSFSQDTFNCDTL